MKAYFGSEETGNTFSKELNEQLEYAKDLVAMKICRRGLFSNMTRVDFAKCQGEGVSAHADRPIWI